MYFETTHNIILVILSFSITIAVSSAIYYISRNGYVTTDVGTTSLIILIIDKATIATLTIAFVHLTIRKWPNIKNRGSLLRMVESINSINMGITSCIATIRINSIEVKAYLLLSLLTIATTWGLSKGINTDQIIGACNYNEKETHATVNCTNQPSCGLPTFGMGGFSPVGITRTTNILKNGIDNNITVLGNANYSIAAHVGNDILFSANEVSVYNLKAIAVNTSCIATNNFTGASMTPYPHINMTSFDSKIWPPFFDTYVLDFQGLYVLTSVASENTNTFAIILSDQLSLNPMNQTLVGWLNDTQKTLKWNIVTLVQCNYTAKIGLVNITQKNNLLQSSISNLKTISPINTEILNIQMTGFNYDALTISNGNTNPDIDPYKYDGRYISGLETDFAKYIAASSIVLTDRILINGDPLNYLQYTNDTFLIKSCNNIQVTTIRYWPLLYIWLIINTISFIILSVFAIEEVSERNNTCSGITLNTLIWQALTTKWGLTRLLLNGNWNTDQKDIFISKMNAIQERLEASKEFFGLIPLGQQKYVNY
ncbi:7723_t:CDS:1 [Scutellospora calospora]|uniref:7723_t:CDS:1 n=1 Tax=Scutellospora calospora TaxID=85575 RepID=A0ACA9KVP3_9GLOM|nr:7723_t:CDS:1 [Scutellospora calospora]